ncbi:MAG: hypothetical protein V3V04_05650 [Rhizobiaceae bacterium]
MKFTRFNKVSAVIAVACAIGFVVAKDSDISITDIAPDSQFFDKEFFFTIGALFTFFTFWK